MPRTMPTPPAPFRRVDPLADTSARRIYAVLRAAIRRGELDSTDALAEHDLVPSLRAGRNSLRAALQMLASEGMVTRRQRVGTRVSGRPVLHIASDDDLPADHLDRLRIEHLDQRLIPVPRSVRSRLDVEVHEVYRLEQIVYLDDEPIIWRFAFVADLAGDDKHRDIGANIVRSTGRPTALSATFEAIYGVAPETVESTVEAVAADDSTAEVLQVSPGAPVLLREIVMSVAGGRTVVLGYQHMRADRIAFVNRQG
ncbi:GntR family transcriptional regulator [Pseudonocardia pini]|uniref:GntR family transcriptional regulator n=1 Tax=Pseudonocardia pini TaxID=2758030 RepID=UPI0015F00AE2|nr:GntR family transcriptional regulator [Pseudonocardia pini]